MARDETFEEWRKPHTAYHEAGHVAMAWMFGDAGNIECIDMRGNWGGWAFVRAKRPWDLMAGRLDLTDRSIRSIAMFNAKKSAMYYLAGYAAQNRTDAEADGSWFDEIRDADWEWEGDESHDVTEALKWAKVIHNANDNAWRFMRRMAAWADEAFEDPQLWTAVESLAARLQTVKRRISGETATRIMEKSCSLGPLPYLEMGGKWRRRFKVL